MNRSLPLIAIAVLALLAIPGCETQNQSHETLKQMQYGQWNRVRAGVLLQLATQQYEVGDYDKCRETLGHAFALNTPLAPLHMLAAKVEMEKGSLELADQHLKTAITIDAANPECYYLLGVLYQRWQNFPAARDYYKLAFEKKPSDASYLTAEVEMKLTLGEVDEAQKLLEDKQIYFEQSAALRAALGRIHTMKKEFDLTAKSYREAMILNPEELSYRRSFAEASFYAGHYTDAIESLEALNKKEDLPNRMEVLMLLGQSYLKVGRSADARNMLSQVTREEPQNVEAWLCLGKACVEEKEYAQAGSCARRVLKNDPDHVQALVLLGLVQQKQKKWRDAEETLTHAASIAPADATILCMLGVGKQSQGKTDEAAEYYQKAVQANPQDPLAHELLASAQKGG